MQYNMQAHPREGERDTAEEAKDKPEKNFKKVLEKVLTKADGSGIITRSRESGTKTDH